MVKARTMPGPHSLAMWRKRSAVGTFALKWIADPALCCDVIVLLRGQICNYTFGCGVRYQNKKWFSLESTKEPQTEQREKFEKSLHPDSTMLQVFSKAGTQSHRDEAGPNQGLFQGYHGQRQRYAMPVAPSWKMVMTSKKGTISESEYSTMYREHRETWEEVLGRDRVTLVCFCPSRSFCHRYLLAWCFEKLGAEYMGEVMRSCP